MQEKAILRRDPNGCIALANGWHNCPTNLILLDKRVHSWLHSTAIRWSLETYRREKHMDRGNFALEDDWVSWSMQAGLPITNPRYDIYLAAIATVRTLYMIEKVNSNWFPFEKVYKKHAEIQFYELCGLIPNFMDSFVESLS